MTTPGPYDDMGAAIDEMGEEWAGVTAESGALAHVTIYRGATLLAVHDPKNNTTTVIRLSAEDAETLGNELLACANSPDMSDDAVTDGGWLP